ncbi:MAG TPA: hypothetical protein VMX16_18900 [Terriglobia bacterium]|nr:hypothetical protein [Terriglobia bacterium]
MDSDILHHYESTNEADRLLMGTGQLVMERTEEIIRRRLPVAPERSDHDEQ